MTMRDLGVLIVGHGTRDLSGQGQMRSLACQIAGCLAPLASELAFLELAEPTIAQGVARLAAAGVRRLATVPVLLFRAGHAERDIPEAVAAAASAHAIEVIGQTAPLEHQSAVVELSAERFSQGLERAGCAATSPDRIALGLIARGSSSASAAAAMDEFARLRNVLLPVGAYRVGYAAVRRPTIAETLDWLASTDAQVLVVQPHLLFEGEVFHALCSAVEERRARDARRWVVCRPLGASAEDFHDQRLAEVLAGLATERIAACARS